MKRLSRAVVPVLFLLAVLAPQAAFAAIPLPSAPSWTSIDNDYATGGAFADINGDGWIDFVTSNGNDMNMDFNGVYMNNLGTLETITSWRSLDAGFFGHCYAGDVDNDGDMDLAVAYLGRDTFGDHQARVYRNTGSGLEATPSWKAGDLHSSFDCCLGDFDVDGDLDLAISAGDAYDTLHPYDRTRIYRNSGGVFDTLPYWSASDSNPGDAVRFCDIDNDGDLDLFVGQVIPHSGHGKVVMYRNVDGIMDTVPTWTAQQGVGWVLRLALADYDGDGYLDLAAASNNQQGEPNSIKVFHNNGGTLDTIASFTMLRSKQFSSCVAWADVNGDAYPDLAAGGWWEPVAVFENHAGVLDTTAGWAWYPAAPGSLVCETVVWGDLTNSHLSAAADSFDGNGQRRLFSLRRRPVQFLDSVCVGGVRLPAAGFCSDPLVGWVSFASAPPLDTANVVFFYRYSVAPDLAVTNWESNRGNYVFLNTTSSGVSGLLKPVAASRLAAWPNPAAGLMRITLCGPTPAPGRAMTVCDMTGRVRRTLSGNGGTWTWDGRDEAGRPVVPGVYFAALGSASPKLKLVRVSHN